MSKKIKIRRWTE